MAADHTLTVEANLRTGNRGDDADSSAERGPLVDPDTHEIRRSPVANAADAFALASKYFKDRSEANKNCGVIQRKYNGEPPHSEGTLAGWRANFSVKTMSTLVDRKTPVLVSFVDGLRYLTASRLPGDAVDAHDKSEKFQGAITRLIRGWSDWRTFLYPLATEEVLFGYDAAGFLDEHDWRPVFFRQDQFAVPAGCNHAVRDLPAVAFRKTFQVYELTQFIEDPKAAEAAGWDVDNVVEAINGAMPAKRTGGSDGRDARDHADQQREVNVASAARDEAKVVETFVVAYREYTGEVSQYVVLEQGGKELLFRENLYRSMEDAVALFSLQHGNGRLYGSVGLGRVLFGLHVARDRNFCQWSDNTMLAGLARFKTDQQNKTAAALTVNYPFITTTGTGEFTEDNHQANMEAHDAFEAKVLAIAEQLSNTFLPDKSGESGERQTAREIIDNARRENFQDGDTLARFYGQFCQLIGAVQRRVAGVENLKVAAGLFKRIEEGKTLVSPEEYEDIRGLMDADDPSSSEDDGKDDQTPGPTAVGNIESDDIPTHLDREAVLCLVSLLKDGLTVVDIYRLARAPASEPMGDNSAQLGAKLSQARAKYAGSPFVDQARLTEMGLASDTTPQIADELILKHEVDQSVLAEAQRQQLMEIAAMEATGQPVPVSARDPHPIHCDVLRSTFLSLVPNLPAAPNPQFLTLLANGVKHFQDHVDARKAAGEKGEALTKDEEFARTVAGQLARLQQAAQAQATAVSEQQAAQTAQGVAAAHATAAQVATANARQAGADFAASKGLADRQQQVGAILDGQLAPAPAAAPISPVAETPTITQPTA